jgi:hypothetical protein
MDMRDSIDFTFQKIEVAFADSEVYFYLFGGDSDDDSTANALYILKLIDANNKYILKGARLRTYTIDALAIDSRTGTLLHTEPHMGPRFL